MFRNSLDTQLSLLYIQLTPKGVLIKDARTGVVGPAFLSWEKNEPNYSILGNNPQAVPAMENRSENPMDVEWVEGSFLTVIRRFYESVEPLMSGMDRLFNSDPSSKET